VEDWLTARSRLTIEVGQDDDCVTIISCRGDVDRSTLEQLRDAIAWSMTLDLRTLRVDATNVSFIDSAGVSCLLATSLQCEQRGAKLELIASDAVTRILELAGLSDLATGDLSRSA
jgi:anti-sigma B factor antagonist